MAKKEIPADIAKMSFEEALEALRGLVDRLESGEGKLDEAVSSYERGVLLKRHCEAKLQAAKEQVEKITLGAGGAEGSEAFDPE